MNELVQIPAQGQDAELTLRVRLVPGCAGPTLLYLHGFGSSQDGDKAAFFAGRAARAELSFVSLDFQGHGRSGGSMRGLSLSRCLRDVARTRRHLPELQGPVALAGSSMGGLVALWHAAAARPSEAAGALALIAPALGLEETLRRTLGDDGMERWRAEGVLEVTNELGTFELGWQFVEDLVRYPSAQLAERFRAPALIFQGKLDDRVSWSEVAAFARATSKWTRLELIEDGDHRLIDRLDWIWTETLEFLRVVQPGGLPAVE